MFPISLILLLLYLVSWIEYLCVIYKDTYLFVLRYWMSFFIIPISDIYSNKNSNNNSMARFEYNQSIELRDFFPFLNSFFCVYVRCLFFWSWFSVLMVSDDFWCIKCPTQTHIFFNFETFDIFWIRYTHKPHCIKWSIHVLQRCS